jgi:hypothetical protein
LGNQWIGQRYGRLVMVEHVEIAAGAGWSPGGYRAEPKTAVRDGRAAVDKVKGAHPELPVHPL